MADRQQRAERQPAGAGMQGPSGSKEIGAAQERLGDGGSSSATEVLKEDAKAAAQDLEHEVEERAKRWTSAVGQEAESLARALRVARDSLWTEGQERMASVVGQAADQVDRMSGYLEDEDPSAMLDDLAEMGRKNPGAFLGSAFTIGLATGRFLRASPPERREAPASAEARR